MSLRLSRRWVSIIAPIALFGCSVIAKSEAPQCAKDCRATQECVAALGEGFLCRRDRDDPQKKGVCQQLTPSSDCTILGDYKNDQVVLLGALLPGRASPAFAAAVQRGLERAVDDWSGVERQLQTQTTGADTVAPPRPFAFIACSEDVPEADLRNIYLNSGTRLVVGPAVMNAQTELLTTELTNAKIVFVSPTTFAAPAQGANVGTYFFRLAGNEAALGNVLKDVAPKPTALFRQTTSYVGLATALTTAIPGLTPVTYDDPNAFTFSGDPNSSVAVLGDGGCGIESPLDATRRALDGHRAENSGFLRKDSLLAVVYLTDEDDCSVQLARRNENNPVTRDCSTPDQDASFDCYNLDYRCLARSLRCDQPMNTTGQKTNCKERVDNNLESVSKYSGFLKSLRPAEKLLVSGIWTRPAIEEGGKVVISRSGGGTTSPVLNRAGGADASCYNVGSTTVIGQAQRRLTSFAKSIAGSREYSICDIDNYGSALSEIAQTILDRIKK
jgi:hypothetical protein